MAKANFDKLQRAVAKNFDRIAAVAVADTDNDPDLQTYEGLTPQAFSAISAKYGPDNLVKYVKTMEARRLKKRAGGMNGRA